MAKKHQHNNLFWCKNKNPVWRPKNSVISELEHVDLYIDGNSMDSKTSATKSHLETSKINSKTTKLYGNGWNGKIHKHNTDNITDFRFKSIASPLKTRAGNDNYMYASPQQNVIVMEHMNSLLSKRNSSLQRHTSSLTPRFFVTPRNHLINLTGLNTLPFPSSPKLGATNPRKTIERRHVLQTSRRVLSTKDVKLKPLLGNVSRASDLAAEIDEL